MILQLLRLLLPFFAGGILPLLFGCAALTKGSWSSVRLDIPQGTEIYVHTPVRHRLSFRQRDSALILKLKSGEDYLLDFKDGEKHDSIQLISEIKIKYLIADFFLYWLIAIPVDILNDYVYDFDDNNVWFPTSKRSVEEQKALPPTLTIHQLTKPDSTILGITVSAYSGLRWPFNQTPILGNDFGAAIGYHLVPNLVVMGNWGGSVLMNYAPEGSHIYMEANVLTVGLETRYFLIDHLYATAGIGYSKISADTLKRTDTVPWQVIPNANFSQWLFGASFGGGFAIQGFFMEFRENVGFKKLQITEMQSIPVHNPEFRFGINFEL